MSATRDSSQNATFVFSSLYQMYLKQKSGPAGGATPLKGLVLQTAGGLASSVSPETQKSYLHWAHHEAEQGKKSLASHLLELRRARKKLSFLIQEMDELLKKEE